MSHFQTVKNKIIQTSTTKLLLTLLFIAAITLNISQTLDTSSKQYIDKAFNRALITFGIAKTLNGVISVAQGTEIAFQPAGIGINLTPGQILDPVNDLVERFSWIMLVSTTSLGIQKIFLTMSVWPVFSYILSFILLIGLIVLFSKEKNYFKIIILRASLLLIVLRFSVPIAGLASEAVYYVFLENDYISSTANLKFTTQEIDQLNKNTNQPNIDKKSVWESARDFYQSTSEMLDINKKIEEYKNTAEETTRYIVNLIVVFVFQTLIIPLGFIFILYTLFQHIIKIKFIE